MRSCLLRALAMAILLTTASARAASPDPDAEERLRITVDRASAQARFAAEERACLQRFVVTSCVVEARAALRASLDPLRRRQIELDTARRERIATERSAAITAKASDDDRRRGANANGGEGTPEAQAPANVAVPNFSRAPRAARPPAPREAVPHARARPLTPHHEDADMNRRDFEARQKEAVDHRVALEARNALQAKTHKAAAPLPAPTLPPARPASQP